MCRLAVVVCVWLSVAGSSLGQQDKPSQPSSPSSPGSEQQTPPNLNQPQGSSGEATGDSPPPPPPAWVRCVVQASPEGRNSEDIATVLDIWCRNYETIITCMDKELTDTSRGDNPLDYFVSLNFDPERLRTRSQAICSNLTKHGDKLMCTESANTTIQEDCGRTFNGGMGHIFGLHKERDAPTHILKEIACDVTLQTTFCLRASLASCEVEVQTTLVNYYSLFTNQSCIAQPQGPPEPEPIIARCARQAASSVDIDPAQSQPSSVLDFLILGINTDCKTYEARYNCYRKELQNITNFRDFWLSLTFDHDNAVASQKNYCGQVQDRVIKKLNDQCFQAAQEGLAACESGFANEMETIRDQWVNDPNFDGLQLQTLACGTSVTRAACLDKAMQPCGEDVARAMAVSEMGILPDTCRNLLRQRPDGGSTQGSTMPGMTGNDGSERENPQGNMAGHGGSYPLGPITGAKDNTGVGGSKADMVGADDDDDDDDDDKNSHDDDDESDDDDDDDDYGDDNEDDDDDDSGD
ncbi:hypothetical protein ElyMa_000135400 [Elysia marginata]|uniref:DUF19 domain-containing protein n=1 Tax=Elysia marginata TaxID=1093978 RepID=A0AAV4ENM8_9GAST|nr:hypothetical protein ElyMa_000135400 [Elysia marginata]